ncbi:hypothetical protein KGM_214299 [Danaus plexippus plexippus]|uniref:Uncharacterized protein n=1 Tax=Danaus plexippus plexippus TaxID=278856 RepID=A0A212F9I9_DANPL|nr:hypothetical protein KGM_214299 [Danaus plexippus plexippus]
MSPKWATILPHNFILREYLESAASYSKVKNWVKYFRLRREIVEDICPVRRSVEVLTPETIALIEEERYKTGKSGLRFGVSKTVIKQIATGDVIMILYYKLLIQLESMEWLYKGEKRKIKKQRGKLSKQVLLRHDNGSVQAGISKDAVPECEFTEVEH